MVRIISLILAVVLFIGCAQLKPMSDVSFSSEIKQVLSKESKKPKVNDIQGRLKNESKGHISSITLKDVAVEDFLKVVFSEVLKQPYVLDRSIEKISKRIDIEIPESYSRTNLYSVIVALMDKVNIEMEEIEGVTVFSLRGSASAASSTAVNNNGVSSKTNTDNKVKSDCVYTYKPQYSKAADLQKALKDLISSEQGRVIIQESTNTLIFKTSQAERRAIIKLLKVMDEQQKQIAVDITIAEVSLTQDLALGLEGFLKNNNVNIGVVNGDVLGYGLSGTVTLPDALNAVLQIGEKRGVIKIKSNPYLLIENGSKSSISIGSEYPVLSTQKSSTETTTTTQTVEYKKTGVILSITPVVTGSDIHINSSVELSEGQKNDLSTLDSPAILTRKIESSVVVQSGQQIIIGGLISESRSRKEKLLPEIWGQAFKTGESGEARRTELVIIMQVSVINNEKENWFEMLSKKYQEQKIKAINTSN